MPHASVVRLEHPEIAPGLHREPQHAQRGLGHRGRLVDDLLLRRRRERRDGSVGHLYLRASLQHVLGRALDEQRVRAFRTRRGFGFLRASHRLRGAGGKSRVRGAHHHGHRLPSSVEFEDGEAMRVSRDRVADGGARGLRRRASELDDARHLRVVLDAELLRENLERALGGLARTLEPAVPGGLDDGVVAGGANFGERREAGVQLREPHDASVARVVGRPQDVEGAELTGGGRARHHHARRGHLVGGERARLVAADHRRAPERLHRLQLAHDGVLLGHLPRAEREAGGYDRGQPLRDGGHRERDRDLEVVGALRKVKLDVANRERRRRRPRPRDEKLVVHHPHQQADDPDRPRQLVAEIVQLLL
mmetsp:Transcript_15108/g.64695  ORF Transcript_15108/g.64695 Transcript_15108/m.64695 type:complete len:364 (-) Transcript_15108:890-1981(-)